MPSTQSKRIFVGGLDRDTDLRALKNGDYHHALNIRNISSEANTEGVVENIKGNKKIDYDFPKPPTSGKRRITLFMPSRSYFRNYGGSSLLFGQSIVLENFDGHLRDENDPYTTTVAEPAIDENGNITLDENGLAYNVLVEQTTFPFPDFFLPSGLPATFDDTVINFDISIGFSLAEMQNPTNNFQIAYNGETHINMLNYLTFWVSQNQNAFANLGIQVSVIDNNSPYFNNEYFFGQSTLNNITSHPDYTPGQVWAHALLFEGNYSTDGLGNEEGIFYIDLKKSASIQPLYLGASDSITGSLFTADSNGSSPFFLLPDSVSVEDGYGYANEPNALNDSTDWSVSESSDVGELYLTEYVNQLETVGWTINYEGAGELISELGHPVAFSKPIIRANATIVNDVTSNITPSYSTIGAYEDTRNDKIYWMVASDIHFHLILEYDIKTNSISTVFRDSGNLSTSVFNWQKEFLINDIDRVGDVLYWTSRQYGEPCSINVRKSKNSIALIDSSDDPYVLNEEGGTDNISLEDYYPYSLYDPDYPADKKREYVEVIKRGPKYAPSYVYDSDTTISKNHLFGNLFQFRYRYLYYDNEISPWSPVSDITPSTFDNKNESQTNIAPGVDNFLKISVKNSSGIIKKIEIAGRKCKDLGAISRGNRGPYFIVATIDNDFSAWQIDQESEQEISFYNDQAYPPVEAGEGERLFDAVPRSAQTQTILGNNRLAYGNYTESFDVPKVNITVNPQYGFNQAGPYGGLTYVNPSTLQVGETVSSFKSGAYHSFGIVYYDEKGRCSTVLTDDNSKCYVKFPTERTTSDNPSDLSFTPNLTGAVTMKWEIFNRAPSWAKCYRWFYSRNNTVDEFVQFRVLQAFTNQDPASNDNRIFLSLRGLKGSDDSYITVSELDPNAVPNPDISILDYEFTKGDRVRIITQGSQVGTEFDGSDGSTVGDTILTSYIDARVSGFEFYAQNNPNIPIQTNTSPSVNALEGDGSEDGWYLIIDELIDSNGNPIANYSAASVAANTDLLEQAVVEIYKIKPDAEPGELLYFEFSEVYEISQFGGRHLGPISDQSGGFTTDAFGNTTSPTPASGEFLFGDVYYKRRNMQRFSNNIRGFEEFYVEDYFLNDYTDSNHISIGRANIYSSFYKQHDKEASVTFSDVYQPASNFNGLSTFDYNLGNWEDYSRIYGTIQKLFYRENDIVMIQEDATYKIPIQRDILLSADGKGTLGVSNKVLNPVVPFAGNYGISKNPESFVANGMVLYWTDIRRGSVIRLSGDGITPISDAKMHDYFRDKEEEYRIYDPQFGWDGNYGVIQGSMLIAQHKNFRIKGGFNPKHEEYIVQMDPIPNPEGHWGNVGDAYETLQEWEEAGGVHGNLIEGSVVAWRDKQKRWTSFYSHIAEYYCKINRLFVSWDEGFLYLHDIDSDNYNTFYGITYNTELSFSINNLPSTVKGFKAITLEANQAFELDNNDVEETENSSYDLTLVTDMTETSIDRRIFDQRENKQYVQIPFVTTNSTGSEIIGLGLGTGLNNDDGIGVIAGSGTNFGAANIILGTSTDVTNFEYGDQLFFNDGTSDILVGTISDITSDNVLVLSSSIETFNNQFLFIKRPAISEGDRMKGRFMEVRMKKRSKRFLEIFSGSATIFNSELSDD